MPLYQAIVLAIVQALTEFLPISSTAHLTLVPWLLKWRDPGLTFDVALHAGTLIAVAVYFWREWVQMAAALFGSNGAAVTRRLPANPGLEHPRRLLSYLVLATLPAAIAGWFFEEAVESVLRSPLVIAVALIVVALLMWAGERLSAHRRTISEVTLLDAVLVGLAQAVAIIPGVSRSGITMTAGLFRGMTRQASARFSFLLSTPVIAGAALKEGVDVLRAGLPDDMLMPFVIGTVVAGFFGYLVVAGLLRYLATNTFRIFILYRLILGVIIFLLGWGGRVTP
jgi:undecaprenyl-diphosphatase